MNTQSILEAQHADGFVDYYALINTSSSTDNETLREQINALYKEAQTNRDHRTPTRRREAEFLLELLPQARTVLLDPKRRRRYDAYRGAVEMQSPRMAFEEFLPSLLAEKEKAPTGADILSLSPRTLKAPLAPGAEPVAPVKVEAPPVPEAATPTSKSRSIALPLGSIVGGAGTFLGLITTLSMLVGLPLAVCALLALLGAGVVGYVFSLAGELETQTAPA